jgi:hypothetical protein
MWHLLLDFDIAHWAMVDQFVSVFLAIARDICLTLTGFCKRDTTQSFSLLA